jgi:hypothetical protein
MCYLLDRKTTMFAVITLILAGSSFRAQAQSTRDSGTYWYCEAYGSGVGAENPNYYSNIFKTPRGHIHVNGESRSRVTVYGDAWRGYLRSEQNFDQNMSKKFYSERFGQYEVQYGWPQCRPFDSEQGARDAKAKRQKETASHRSVETGWEYPSEEDEQ